MKSPFTTATVSTPAGFTLTELLVVLAVLGILATMAIPSFKSLTQSQRVKNASFELFSSLSLARNEAIKRNSNVTLTGTTNTKNEVGWVISAGSAVIRTQSTISGVNMTILHLSGTGLVYRRNGRAVNIDLSSITTAPTFEIYAANTTAAASPFVRCITIELNGMPRVRQGRCT